MEQESKTTPGPWRVVVHSWAERSVYAGERGGDRICTLSIADEADENTQDAMEASMAADARLIAAAPDLLEALKCLLSEYEGVYDCVDNDDRRYQSQGAADAEALARSALAKAGAQS